MRMLERAVGAVVARVPALRPARAAAAPDRSLCRSVSRRGAVQAVEARAEST